MYKFINNVSYSEWCEELSLKQTKSRGWEKVNFNFTY